MSAIDFVVRDGAGNLQRGSLAGDDTPTSLIVGSGQDISLNLRRTQVRGYEREGQALEITLIDGRVITIEGFFTADGSAENQLFISADGLLAEVMLTSDGTGDYYAQYVDADSFGKWSPDDDLYFVRGNDVMIAEAAVAGDAEAGMLAAPLMGGLGGIGSLLGLGGAGVGAVVLSDLIDDPDGDGDDDDTSGPSISLSTGVGSAGHVVNEVDHSDGVEIGGTGEIGATVAVTVAGVTITTTVANDGTWEVVFPSTDIATGEYTTDVSVTITDDSGATATVTDTLVLDTISNLGFSTATVEGEGTVNAAELSDGVTLTGTSEAGSTVVVTIDGMDYNATVGTNGDWTLDIPSTNIASGEYDLDVVAVATDQYGNVTSTTQTLTIDTETDVVLGVGLVGGDGTVNASEHAGGVDVTGFAEAGATVEVTLGSVTHTVIAASDGSWSSTFTSAEIPTGTYVADVSVLSTDLAGNTATASGIVNIDTDINLSVDTASVEGDGIVNASEASDGVTLTGTAEAGATVDVTMDGVTHSTVALSDGTWSVDFSASEIRSGTFDAAVSVTATDTSGNVQTVTSTVEIDTEAAVAFSAAPVEGDNIINADEASDGVVLTGTSEPGSTVMIAFGTGSYPATVDANGNWSVTLPASVIAAGEYATTAVATATDINGNTSTATLNLDVDTVTSVAVDTSALEGDGVVNALERADGITLTGTSEAGALVAVTMAGVTRTVTANSAGAWSADFTSAEIPTGETVASVSVTATDAAGNTATTTGNVNIDTLVTDFASTSTPGGDGVINASEAAAGVSLSGTTEIGSTVSVTMGGVTLPASVDASGNWSVTFGAGSLPAGEYTTSMVVTATDAAGNTTTMTESVDVDTVVGDLTLSSLPIETDDVINYDETLDGVVIHGTSTPGEVVTVTLGTATHMVTTASDGTWTTTYLPGEIPSGTYEATITAMIEDSAGNTRLVTDTVDVDTVASVAFSATPVEGDDVISASEQADGVTITGTAEAGTTSVVVQLGAATHNATVDANGNWTVDFAATDLPSGEYLANMTATATDAAGNTAVATDTIRIDNIVNELSLDGPIEGDNIVSLDEAADGVVLTGRVEAGSSVNVSFGSVTQAAVVDASGNWTVTFEADDIPSGEYTTNVTIEAVDAAGNTDSVSDTVSVDTTVPGAPFITSFTRSAVDGTVRRIGTLGEEDGYSINAISADGTITEIAFTASSPFSGETEFTFNTAIPDGSQLIVTAEDASGNENSTLFLFDGTAAADLTSTVGLDGFNIGAIDMPFSEAGTLTLTAETLAELSDNNNELTINGGGDDTVVITGATVTGTTTINGDDYDIYSLGDDGGSLIIQEDISVVI